MLQPNDMWVVLVIDTIDDDFNIGAITIKERFRVEALVLVTMNFENDDIKEYDEMVKALHGRGSYTYAPKKVDLELKNRTTPPIKPSIEEPHILKLKAFPSHL